ncbi:MAG: hypothetical protein SW833_25245 [Cyanobacteriota bacterium]|nr:hypothetical protein [Cyanobacteriota bacterium]
MQNIGKGNLFSHLAPSAVLTLVGYGGLLIRAEETDLQLPPNPPYMSC